MAKKMDLIGKKFEKLKVIEELKERKNGRVVWRCKCDCGNYIDVVSTYLTTGQTTSCGCVKKKNWKEKIYVRNITANV